MTIQHAPAPQGNDVFHEGHRARLAREQAGYKTLVQFAKALGVDDSTLRTYERTGKAKRLLIDAYVRFTEVRPKWLTDADGPMYEPGTSPNPGGLPGKITIGYIASDADIPRIGWSDHRRAA